VRYFYRIGDAIHWAKTPDELIAEFPDQGVAPTSFTFILGRLSDNKILLQIDPGYRARLMSLPMVERERLLGKGQGGNWAIRPAAGLYFRRAWFRTIAAPPTDFVQVVRAWDKAATQPSVDNPDPAWTRGVKMGITRGGRIVILHLESLRGSPAQVLQAMLNTAAQDGIGVKICIWQDPAQAGKVDVALTKSFLSGYWVESEVAREDKLVYAGPFSTQVEAGNVDVLQGPWNEALLSELEGFPDGRHKDITDACSRAFMAISKAGVRVYQDAMALLAKEMHT